MFGNESRVKIFFIFVFPVCGPSRVVVWIIDLYKRAPTSYVSVEIYRIEYFPLYVLQLST